MPRTSKRGDTRPAWTGVASDAEGPYPLGAFTELLLLARSDTRLIQVVVEAVAPAAGRGDSDCGRWAYTPLPEDVAHVGAYKLELQCTRPDGGVMTFPNEAARNDTLTLDSDLNPEA